MKILKPKHKDLDSKFANFVSGKPGKLRLNALPLIPGPKKRK